MRFFFKIKILMMITIMIDVNVVFSDCSWSVQVCTKESAAQAIDQAQIVKVKVKIFVIYICILYSRTLFSRTWNSFFSLLG